MDVSAEKVFSNRKEADRLPSSPLSPLFSAPGARHVLWLVLTVLWPLPANWTRPPVWGKHAACFIYLFSQMQFPPLLGETFFPVIWFRCCTANWEVQNPRWRIRGNIKKLKRTLRRWRIVQNSLISLRAPRSWETSDTQQQFSLVFCDTLGLIPLRMLMLSSYWGTTQQLPARTSTE